MPKNQYFSQGFYQPEKDLLMKLSQEVISIHGINLNWIQNPYTNVDGLYHEDRLPDLGLAKTIVAYVKDGMQGISGEALYSKFGFMNQQTMTIQISVKEWKEVFNTHRPLEGDIFYVPGFDEYGPMDFFKVTFVDRDETDGWFPLGKHHVFEVTAEKWAYSSEDFAHTGVTDIDDQLPDWTNDTAVNPNLEAAANKVNAETETISDAYVEYNPNNPFGSPS